MEASEQQSARKSKLRYPLRSASKSISREDKEKPQISIPSSAHRRAPSTLSKSVSVLQLSGEDKSARPPRRRLSVPPKSVATTALKPPATAGNITPISEIRVKRSATKNDTPLSNASMASTRKKFNAIALASYWLSQIKISESVAKHSISLAFFKLALEAGCETIKSRLRSRKPILMCCLKTQLDHLMMKSTALFSVTGTRKLRPRSLNADAAQVSIVTESTNKETSQRKNTTAIRTRGSSLNKNTENSRTVSDSGVVGYRRNPRRVVRKKQPRSRSRSRKRNLLLKKVRQSLHTDFFCNSWVPTAAAITPEENKENMVNCSHALIPSDLGLP
ncbi:rab11 family-interacting protein [Salix suchowensis]|nr:rab11 family-interacting protein [Salix suchowensis]